MSSASLFLFPKPAFPKPSFPTILLIGLVWAVSASASLYAEDFYVSTAGDDSNPGTRSQPFRTVSHGALALSPGDGLFVLPGIYRDEETIFVRFVGPEPNFEFMPIVGAADAVTRIIGIRDGGRRPVIFGNFDVRGSFIRIAGLEIRGDREKLDAGIGVFESHNITIKDCRIFNHGGGGIAFNQCDLVSAVGNWVGFNAFTNPNQSSGISLFQSVVRTESDRYYGAVIVNNISLGNENLTPPAPGARITDGNGIIADDFLYTQNFGVVQQAMLGMVDPQSGTGIPVIDFDENGLPMSYSRRTLIRDNVTLHNGGRGIHAFQSDNIDIVANLSFFNLSSADLTQGLPRDAETGDAFFFNGEINLTDSQNAWVSSNFGVTRENDAAGGAEQFFERAPQDGISDNRWVRNRFRNFTNGVRDVDVFGVEQSLLMTQGRR